MFQIGPSLRDARIRRGLSPGDVHTAVRIRERYLTALEEERWDMLPGGAYTKGFLRTYAEFLGLDGRLYVDEYATRVAAHEIEPFVPETLGQTGRGKSRILFRTLGAVIVVAGAVAGLAAWRHGGPATSATVAVPARTQVGATGAEPAFAVIRAVGGRSRLSVRIGGPAGREIFRGTLRQGGVLRFGLARRLRVRMGRPAALAVRIGGKTVGRLPRGASTLLLTKYGPQAG